MRLQEVSKKLGQGYKKIKGFYFYVLCLVLSNSNVAFATNKIEESDTYKGFSQLIDDGTKVLQKLAVSIGLLVIVWFLIKNYFQDERDTIGTKKKIFITFMAMIGAVIIVQIFNLILSYFV